jgi:ATP-dependent Lon protease
MQKNKETQSGQGSESNIVMVSDILPDRLIILPIQGAPVFPGTMLPITLTGKKYMDAINVAQKSDPPVVGAVYVKKLDEKDIFHSEFYGVGTTLKILKVNNIAADVVQIIVQGLNRFRLIRVSSNGAISRWEVKYFNDPSGHPDDELKAYAMAIISSVKEILKMNPIFQEQLRIVVDRLKFENPGLLMDLIASMLSATPEKLQDILESFNLYERAYKLMLLLKEEKDLLQLQQKIKNEVEEKINKQQKEFFLREQLRVIKKELGIEKEGKEVEIERLKKKAEALKFTEEAQGIVKNELERLSMLELASPEFNVTRTYLEILTDLPWGIYSHDNHDINKAREILNRDHYGMEDVKARMLEFISTIIKRGKVTGSNILLVGPPGVGKTSIGKSIASAMNRKFYRFSLGGMHDEAEIKGHRRTYIGAMPGKLIESLRRVKTSNPVIMLDELDKMGVSFQGDPASALLEVLDPEQNKNFLDNYLDVRFDLSNVLFIATANQLDTISAPLLDRMEIIRMSGYMLEEKVAIAKNYLVPRQRQEHGLKEEEVNISDDALSLIGDRYAREAGVRDFDNQIKKIMRFITLKQAEGSAHNFNITAANLETVLGKRVFMTEQLYNKNIPGAVLGLAYTPNGGTTIYIEASAVKSKSPAFKQTGQLGKVMQESSEIAYSYIRARTTESELMRHFFEDHTIHLHVPAGATPKDGPSAGVTMALALYSLVSNKPVSKEIAMTGELTLTGKILPIGGVREKTVAARRVGIKEIILPEDNRKDFEELPSYMREGMKVDYASYFDNVLKAVFDTP